MENEKKHIKNEAEELKKKCEEYLNNWKKERANLINYKKEEDERMKGMITFINGATALKIIPILDNFDIVENNLPDGLKNDQNIKGVLLIKKQILDFLKSLKVEQIEAIYKKFDPNFHEAIAEEYKEGVEPGIIIEEASKGYLMDGAVLRAAKVKIAKEPG